MRQIIILNNQLQANGAMTVNYVYWLVSPQTLITPGGTTVVPNAGTAEIAAIQSGSVVEQVLQSQLPQNMPPSDIGNYLITRYTQAQTFLNNSGSIANYTTTYYDGTAWHNLPSGTVGGSITRTG